MKLSVAWTRRRQPAFYFWSFNKFVSFPHMTRSVMFYYLSAWHFYALLCRDANMWRCLSSGCRRFDSASSGSTPRIALVHFLPSVQPVSFKHPGSTPAFILETWLHPLLLPPLPPHPPLSPPIRHFISECFIALCPCRGGPLGSLQTSKKI